MLAARPQKYDPDKDTVRGLRVTIRECGPRTGFLQVDRVRPPSERYRQTGDTCKREIPASNPSSGYTPCRSQGYGKRTIKVPANFRIKVPVNLRIKVPANFCIKVPVNFRQCVVNML